MGSPRAAQRLTTGVGEDVSAVIAPDGRAMAYASVHTAPDVWLLDPETGTTTRVTSETTVEEAPRMSPDGRRLLFYSNRTGVDQLWVQDLESGALNQISLDGAHEGSWSPDGLQVAYGGFGATQGITVRDVATGAGRTLVPHLLVSHPGNKTPTIVDAANL